VKERDADAKGKSEVKTRVNVRGGVFQAAVRLRVIKTKGRRDYVSDPNQIQPYVGVSEPRNNFRTANSFSCALIKPLLVINMLLQRSLCHPFLTTTHIEKHQVIDALPKAPSGTFLVAANLIFRSKLE